MAYERRVFVAHAFKDTIVMREVPAIVANVPGWHLIRIPTCSDWLNQALAAITDCDLFVFIDSEDARRSEFCTAEREAAEQAGKHVLVLPIAQLAELDRELQESSVKPL